MAVLHSADQEQLHKLLLGQLSTADVERLATEYADDGRLAELAEALAGKDDALLTLLHNHETAVVDPEGERLVERLLGRLKPAFPDKPREDTLAMNNADASTEPSSPDVTGKPQPLPERLEYYRPIKVLGQGGMGTVYLAKDTRLGREVAIKTLRAELAINPQFKQRFLREARTAAKLEHDNVIPIYSVGEADGTPFPAMPLLKGEPLDALIRRTGGPLPVAMVVRLAREAASGLAAAHARGLIHRDIKPANIWLEAPTGRVKILDFGLAKAADAGGDAESDTHLTASGAIVGTPAYMAPEQASGHAVNGRADLFSLGCVLYELLSGKRAFSGPNTMSILMSLANHTPTAPDKLSAQCPAALSRLVMQLLEKDPANRPASAEAVIEALDQLEIAGVPASRAASAPGLPPGATAVRGLTPSGSPNPAKTSEVLETSEVSPTDLPRPSNSLMTLPATAVLPVRKRAIPMPRVALALAGVLLMLLAAVVYRIQTDKGTLIVEISDSSVEAILKSKGLEVRDSKSGRSFSIQAAGSHREVTGDFKLVDGYGLKLVVLDADGLELKTNEFKLVRDGKVRVRVTAETNGMAATTSPVATDPDRRAAEYVLSIGGQVDINGRMAERFRAVADLPQEPFRLTQVWLQHNTKVTDAGLAVFQGCKNVEYLQLDGTSISDAGLAHFQGCQNLKFLVLSFCSRLTDAGLRHFKDCKNLVDLRLTNTAIGDTGLANFQDCPKLATLLIAETPATDAGLAHFKDCKKLLELSVGGKNVTDAGLANFQDCRELKKLRISKSPQVTDAALANFRDCQQLQSITFEATPITDAGLAVFKDCPNLEKLLLQETKVTGAGLVHFQGHQKLADIDLRNNPVTDAELAHLARCTNLSMVGLVGTKITADGLAHLRSLTKLKQLGLDFNPQMSAAALTHVRASPGLEVLRLRRCQIKDDDLPLLKEWRLLNLLDLSETPVTDAGLHHLKELKNLTLLRLEGTTATAAGINELHQSLPRCRIFWNGGTIEPSNSND